MEDISLLDAIGIASMLGELGSSEPSIGSTLDDVLDPTGYYKSHGLDPYGRPLSSGGAVCLLYTSPSPRDRTRSRMPSSA